MNSMTALSVRLPAELKAWLTLRATASGRSMNSELIAILQLIAEAEPGVPLEVRKEAGRYVLRSQFGGRVYRTFLHRDIALVQGRNALKAAGLHERDLVDAPEGESCRV